MSQILEEVLNANESYAASFGAKSKLPMPPARQFAILTCMDARLDPAKFAGLSEGDAHVIRNAGGRASDDAIRSLVISYKLLGTREWFVIHHTDCGMLTFTNEVMRDLLAKSLDTASFHNGQWRDPSTGGGSPAGDYVEWLTIKDLAEKRGGRRDAHTQSPVSACPDHAGMVLYHKRVSGKLVEVPEAESMGEPNGTKRAAAALTAAIA